tara:strand:- start:2061 stop:2288 length:228 start_codon:yes stop_codon:yes gene_type:complete
MGLSTLFLVIFITVLGIYSFVLLTLNKVIVHIDLLFLELDLQLGHTILTSLLIGILIAIILEIIFFSSKRKNEDE